MRDKLLSLTFFLCGFTFISGVIALGEISKSLPANASSAIQLFSVLGFATGLGFIASAALSVLKGRAQNPAPRVAPAPIAAPVTAPAPVEKKPEERKEGWQSPSSTGWG